MSELALFEHFCILIDMPKSQHQEYITQHLNNPELIAELTALLNHHFSANPHTQWHDLIAKQAHTVTGDEQLQHLLGSKVGVYTLKKVIGEGGMGKVFLAERHDKLINQQVAIKFFSPSIMQVVGANLAQNQAQILAQLNHPNITYVYDTGVTESGLHYVVMEYVKGVPIDQFCANKNLNFMQRIELFLTVCDAISKTHLINIAHSDIKPANILVSDEGVAKILDFDISKVLQHNEIETSNDGVKRYLRALSLVYASPEQLAGNDLTLATDQYSLAVLLYVLLTNEVPFNVKDKAVNELMTDISAGNAQLLDLDAKTLNMNLYQQWYVQSDIKYIINKAMSVDINKRYKSVKAFKSDIYKALNYFPTEVCSSVRHRVKKWLARNPVIAVSSCLIVVSTISLCVLNNTLYQQPPGSVFSAMQGGQKDSDKRIGKALSERDKLQLFYDIAYALYQHEQYNQAISILESVLDNPLYRQQDRAKNTPVLSLLLIDCYKKNNQLNKANTLNKIVNK
ncbi:serine/threonine protein kinase [Pseudoalteromonas sp. MMG010]|uniref:serine/threonine-protein kinase n=1 Tax=Pseudoalteromonas sp. MMG010 TaxID=2822685 RepID=UPI001B39E9D3|nr:serine/threonine-protein kinase [Pseudoalteromonas sp. MMG010]MBQ4834306.1 serine/threonine protein kinase [Pseudoalteromonas sp. MMG010]